MGLGEESKNFRERKGQEIMARKRNVWNGDDEFSFNISEEEFNKRHKKARKDAEPSGKKKKKKKKYDYFKGLGDIER